ncbi:MAG: glycosyltransferase [Candidatus Aminicenantes bacterium]|jgi:UDP:flavonoid glycosyltransferase YjiC (YdhE family)
MSITDNANKKEQDQSLPPLRWAFFSYVYNYGDCSRAIEVAKAMKKSGAVVKFFHHGGSFEDKIREAGLDSITLEPRMTEQQHEVLMAIDQHRGPIGTPLPFTEEQLVAMVESELEVFKDFKPDGVYCGLNLSCMISVPYAGLSMITLVPTALCPAFFEKGLASFPEAMETNFFVRYMIPKWLKRKLINKIMLGDVMKKAAAIFNKVRSRYGLPPIYNYTAMVRGDLTFLPDLPELSGLAKECLPKGYKYTGPLFAHLQMPIPEEVERVYSRPGLNIFCSMGSSGSPALLKKVVAALRSVEEYNVVCAATNIIDPKEFGPPTDNFFAVRFLPAHKVNEMADISVIHGGQGTVQNAVWSGTPVVGIGFQWEQQANLDGLARLGMGIRIPLHSVTQKRLLKAVETVSGQEYKTEAKKMQKLVRQCNGAEEVVRQMNEFVRPRR